MSKEVCLTCGGALPVLSEPLVPRPEHLQYCSWNCRYAHIPVRSWDEVFKDSFAKARAWKEKA